MKYRGLLGKTKKQQIANAKKLLNYPLSSKESPAGRLEFVMNLLAYEEDKGECPVCHWHYRDCVCKD